MLPIQHAARALGVPDDQIRRLAKQGSIPGAVERNGEWLVPTMSLVTIARQQGWTLDLAALQHQLDEHALSRYSGDALAAQAAVLLAKTQATAARVESRDLLRRLREATTAAAADRAARAEATETLADLRRELEEVRRNHAVAEARLTEIRSRVTSDDQQLQFMADRIKSLDEERHRLNRSLGWFGRLRYRRMVDRDLSRQPTQPEVPAADQQPAGATDQPLREPQPGDEPRPSHRTSTALEPVPIEPAALQQPAADVRDRDAATEEVGSTTAAQDPWPIPTMSPPPPRVPLTVPPIGVDSAATVADQSAGGHVRSNRTDNVRDREPAGLGARPKRRYTQVPRTADGRFDRSALARARSESPAPIR